VRAETISRSASAHSTRPLVVRGGLARTFGSLVSFLGVSFLFCGLYLLADAFAHPLNANSAGIIAAALAITLATILFFYLLKPRSTRKIRSAHVRHGG
jgi:hypothetical protein